jgi:DNA-binding protein
MDPDPSGAAHTQQQHPANLIQVSNTKKPLFFYVNLAKQFLGAHDTVHLSGLGMAVATVVTVAEILKKNGLAAVTRIGTSTVDMVDETNPDNEVQKAKIEIALTKTLNFHELTANVIDQKGYA